MWTIAPLGTILRRRLPHPVGSPSHGAAIHLYWTIYNYILSIDL